jgi:hypothetical protein
MLQWPHSGFHAHTSVRLGEDDRPFAPHSGDAAARGGEGLISSARVVRPPLDAPEEPRVPGSFVFEVHQPRPVRGQDVVHRTGDVNTSHGAAHPPSGEPSEPGVLLGAKAI